MKTRKRFLAGMLALALVLSMGWPTAAEEPAETPEQSKGVVILYTSDVHCGIDQGFGYEGLWQYRNALEKQGYATLLVDDGDSIQGEAVGTLTKGEAIIGLMNEMKYDVAIPGNHEFDYDVERFIELTKKADFPYICCNFTKEDDLVFAPYVIKEAAGIKIGFVGVTTPQTIMSSHPVYFQDKDGNYIYGFMKDETGEAVYEAVQKAVDAARADGADYIYAMGHLGNEDVCKPWTYADVISHTEGIDVFLDGHSHDTDQVVMKNKAGKDVTRSAVGTKLDCIGYSRISPENGIEETKILSWPNEVCAPEVFDIHNEMSEKIVAAQAEVEKARDEVVAKTDVELTINDPKEVDSSGHPIRMIRRAETNLGDLCADAILQQTGAEIALINGGAIRVSIKKGDITYGDIIGVWPYENQACLIEATGQQIADALEWGAREVPDEFAGFLQVAGLTYEIDASVPSGCKVGKDGMFAGVEGERRVKNIKVGSEALDLNKTYNVAGTDYLLLQDGDGNTAFKNAKLLEENIMVDNQLLIRYIDDELGGVIGRNYEDPYGQGRITFTDNG